MEKAVCLLVSVSYGFLYFSFLIFRLQFDRMGTGIDPGMALTPFTSRSRFEPTTMSRGCLPDRTFAPFLLASEISLCLCFVN